MEFRKIVLINPENPSSRGVNRSTLYPPIGLAMLASVLKQEGFDVQVIDEAVTALSQDGPLTAVLDKRPHLVGISMNVINASRAVQLARGLIKEGVHVVLGGPVASTCYREIYKKVKPYCIVIGEGEQSFLRVCMGERLQDIEGICFMEDGQLKINPPAGPVEDLDLLPFPAYQLLPPLKSYRSRARLHPVAPIITSRGCPFGCAYCNSGIFGRRFRARSPESVVDEIEYLVKDFGVRQIDIVDDNFTLDIERADRILELIIKRGLNIAINLQNGIRADRLTHELVRKMKRAGVYKASIGVESGSPEVLKAIGIRPGFDEIQRAVEWFRAEGISTTAFFIIGLPDDTEESILQSIQYAITLNPVVAVFSRFIPLPETVCYERLKKQGLIRVEPCEGFSGGFFTSNSYFRHPVLSDAQITRLHRMAYRRFYLRPSKILEIIRDMRSLKEFGWLLRSSITLVKELGL